MELLDLGFAGSSAHGRSSLLPLSWKVVKAARDLLCGLLRFWRLRIDKGIATFTIKGDDASVMRRDFAVPARGSPFHRFHSNCRMLASKDSAQCISGEPLEHRLALSTSGRYPPSGRTAHHHHVAPQPRALQIVGHLPERPARRRGVNGRAPVIATKWQKGDC